MRHYDIFAILARRDMRIIIEDIIFADDTFHLR